MPSFWTHESGTIRLATHSRIATCDLLPPLLRHSSVRRDRAYPAEPQHALGTYCCVARDGRCANEPPQPTSIHYSVQLVKSCNTAPAGPTPGCKKNPAKRSPTSNIPYLVHIVQSVNRASGRHPPTRIGTPLVGWLLCRQRPCPPLQRCRNRHSRLPQQGPAVSPDDTFLLLRPNILGTHMATITCPTGPGLCSILRPLPRLARLDSLRARQQVQPQLRCLRALSGDSRPLTTTRALGP
jgi:hypothetical protein